MRNTIQLAVAAVLIGLCGFGAEAIDRSSVPIYQPVRYDYRMPIAPEPTESELAEARLASIEAADQEFANTTVFVAAMTDVAVEVVAQLIEPQAATINVTCPATCTITCEDAPTKQKGVKRLFFTPKLLKAGTLHFRAFVCTQAGCFVETQEVHVNPGEVVDVTLLAAHQAAAACPCGPGCDCTSGQCGGAGCPSLYRTGYGVAMQGCSSCSGGGCGGGGCGGGMMSGCSSCGGGSCGMGGCGGGGCGGGRGGCRGGRCR